MAVICVYPWFWFLFFIFVMLLYQIENNAIWLEFLICILLAYIVCKGWKNILGIWNWQTELLGRFFQLLAYLCSLTIPSGLSYWSVIFTLKKVFFFFFLGFLKYSLFIQFMGCFFCAFSHLWTTIILCISTFCLKNMQSSFPCLL